MELSTISVAKRFEALANVLREQILSGQIALGSLLPNERELVKQSGLSRGSVREALRVLEAEGLIATKIGRSNGRYAIRPSAEHVRTSLGSFIRGQRVQFPVLLETLETLEPSLAGLAATHRTASDLTMLRDSLVRLKETRSAKRFLEANVDWHRCIAHASHNPILIAIYDTVSPGLLDPHVAGFASKTVREAVVQASARIEEAIATQDPEAARARMQRHVQAYRDLVEPVAPRIVKL